MAVIYGLCDPTTLELRYVGKAIDLPARVRQHRWEASHLQTHKDRWWRSLDREPTVVVLERHPADWKAAERRWIADLRAAGARLTNIHPGGQTSPVEGRGHTPEAKAKMRAAALRNGAQPPSMKGYRHSAETRARLSAIRRRLGTTPPPMGGWNRGMKMSPDIIEKNRRSHKGIPWSPARRAAQERRYLAAGG